MEFTISAESDSDGIYNLNLSDDDQAVDFDDRLNRLLEEQDYDFARRLLDSARNSEITDDRYHFEQLRLLFAKDDIDGFQHYYRKIQSDLENMDPDIVAGIAGLVSSIGQQN